MAFYEESRIKGVCNSFVRWNGWGPPTSSYQITEFCQSKAYTKEEAEALVEILTGWMNGDYENSHHHLWSE